MEIEKLRPRSWISYFRDAWYQHNLLRHKYIEKLEEEQKLKESIPIDKNSEKDIGEL